MFQPSQDTAKLSMTWLWGSKLLAASHTSDQAPPSNKTITRNAFPSYRPNPPVAMRALYPRTILRSNVGLLRPRNGGPLRRFSAKPPPPPSEASEATRKQSRLDHVISRRTYCMPGYPPRRPS